MWSDLMKFTATPAGRAAGRSARRLVRRLGRVRRCGGPRNQNFTGEECRLPTLGFKGSLQHPSKWGSSNERSQSVTD